MPVDNVPTSNQHYNDIADLNDAEILLTKHIVSFEIVSSENLYDEDEDRILRAFKFNRGVKEFEVVIHPDFYIKAASKRTPIELMVDINIVLVDYLYDILPYINAGSDNDK